MVSTIEHRNLNFGVFPEYFDIVDIDELNDGRDILFSRAPTLEKQNDLIH